MAKSKRYVTWRSASYTDGDGVRQTFMRGEHRLSKEAEEALDDQGALAALPKKGDEKPKAPKTFHGMDAEQVADAMKGKTIPQVVNMVDGDPELAKLALSAEDTISGGSSRDQLVEALAMIIGNANS